MANNVLITIPISHFCEKARWALERAGIPYEERPHVQVIHRFAVRRAGGGTTAPVLITPDGVLAESADILAFADAHAPDAGKIYPTDPDRAAEVRALERDFDERLGPEGRAWMYHQLHDRRDLAIRYGCTGVPAWERRILPVTYPVMIRIIDRVLEITPDSARRSEVAVRATFDEVAERLQDGRPYLCGDEFTAADLTFSALSAPVVMPPGYGVPLPGPDEIPPAAAKVVRELREHPAGAHALKMYHEERHRTPALVT